MQLYELFVDKSTHLSIKIGLCASLQGLMLNNGILYGPNCLALPNLISAPMKRRWDLFYELYRTIIGRNCTSSSTLHVRIWKNRSAFQYKDMCLYSSLNTQVSSLNIKKDDLMSKIPTSLSTGTRPRLSSLHLGWPTYSLKKLLSVLGMGLL